jgi:hypothetical protein
VKNGKSVNNGPRLRVELGQTQSRPVDFSELETHAVISAECDGSRPKPTIDEKSCMTDGNIAQVFESLVVHVTGTGGPGFIRSSSQFINEETDGECHAK